MERMSTGLKVLNAKDDAAGTVIAARMKVQLNGNQIAQNNVQNGIAMLSTAEGNLDVIETNLSRIRDLALQAKNGTYSDKEIEAMEDEAKERIAEIDRVTASSKYSQLNLFTGDLEDGVTFQVGPNADENNIITASGEIFKETTFAVLTDLTGDFALHGDGVDLDSIVGSLDSAIDNVTGRKSKIGSAQNRLESALDTLTIQYENLSSAKSIITDADIAAEASNFTQQQILQQVSTSLLAQANQAPSIALSLI